MFNNAGVENKSTRTTNAQARAFVRINLRNGYQLNIIKVLGQYIFG